MDRWAAKVVTAGGLVIIASILAIVGVILLEVVPLFRPARVEHAGGAVLGAPAVALGVDEYRESAYALTPTGGFELRSLGGATNPATVPFTGLDGATVTAAVTLGAGRHLVGTSDGRAIAVDVKFDATFADGKRTLKPNPTFAAPLSLDPERKRPIARLAGALPDAGPVVV